MVWKPVFKLVLSLSYTSLCPPLNLGWLCDLLWTSDAMWRPKVGHQNISVSAQISRNTCFWNTPSRKPWYFETPKPHEETMCRHHRWQPPELPANSQHQPSAMSVSHLGNAAQCRLQMTAAPWDHNLWDLKWEVPSSAESTYWALRGNNSSR